MQLTVSLAVGQLLPLRPQTIQQRTKLSDIDCVRRVGCELLRSTAVYIVEVQNVQGHDESEAAREARRVGAGVVKVLGFRDQLGPLN
jgi:hypothetical protein